MEKNNSNCVICDNCCKVQGFLVCTIENQVIEIIKFKDNCPNFKCEE